MLKRFFSQRFMKKSINAFFVAKLILLQFRVISILSSLKSGTHINIIRLIKHWSVLSDIY